MPAKNTRREYDAPAYYHVYNRGMNGQKIFVDSQDKRKFVSLLKRYLDSADTRYPTYDIQLVAYCVMRNHYHLLVYQSTEPTEITRLMRSVSTAYSMYYNLKYKNKGHVFQAVFRASRIDSEAYLGHISRYIHLNPDTYLTYKWSSLPIYLGHVRETWVYPDLVLDMSPAQYRVFLEEYEDRRALLKEIKDELAL